MDSKIRAVGRVWKRPTTLMEMTAQAACHALADRLSFAHRHRRRLNEAGQTITAEVRISDFIDANDINIYHNWPAD